MKEDSKLGLNRGDVTKIIAYYYDDIKSEEYTKTKDGQLQGVGGFRQAYKTQRDFCHYMCKLIVAKYIHGDNFGLTTPDAK